MQEAGVADDDLSAPLGLDGKRKRRKRPSIPAMPIIAGALALPVIVFAGWALIKDDPFGGEPMGVAPAVVTAAAGTAADPSAPPSGAPDQASPGKGQPAPPAAKPNTKTITIIDGSSGARREVAVPDTPENPAPAAAEQRLTESSRHGPLPKIAPDGTRPADAFARPVHLPAGKANGPRIALVVGGLGIGATVTADALRKLPGPVTLAFSPYGANLDAQVGRARAAGHEVLLQLPMEPFDYPDNDPGPQTLLTSLDQAQNVDRLHWLMSRFQGYVGVANHLGGRFSASEQALGPVLRETAKRGLIYFDDASSTRSLASQIAGANNLPFAKADLILDQVPTPAEIDRALGRLESAARARSVAVGFASALPVSIDRIQRWAKAAESRGITLIPITAVVARANPS
jgi:polysaccharide deacetylase 2 family uncharacterized protein YibQ